MHREAWLYAVAFVGVIAAGVWFVLPRLQPTERPPAPSPFTLDPTDGEDDDAGGPLPDAPQTSWVEVEVAAPQGGLRGPLRDVFGADVESRTGPRAGLQRLRVRPREASVSFGAVGHQWVHRPAASLRDGERITLPRAAPPLIVRVRESDGTPAAHVPVQIHPPVPGMAFHTDEGGTLVLDHFAPGFVRIDFNTAQRSGPVLRLRAGKADDVTVHLDPAWHVQGRLVAPDGAPLVGARVEGVGPGGLLGAAAPTDDDGAFVWRGPAVARAALRVVAPGWSPLRVEITPPAIGALVTDLGALTPSSRSTSFRGSVDALYIADDAHVSIEPAVAAFVREVFGPGHALDVPVYAPIAADGTFEVPDLDANLPMRVRVRGTGVPLDQIVVGPAGGGVELALFPPQGHTLHGRVVDHDGTPREGVALLVSTVQQDGDAPQPGDLMAVSGADGRFRVLGLAQRTVYVRAYVDDRRSLLRRVTLPLPAGLQLQLEPALRDAERRVQGVVRDEAGAPLAGVTVRAAGVAAQSDAEGKFVLDGVESLAPRVRLFYGYEPGPVPDGIDVVSQTLARLESVVPGGDPLVLTVRRSGRLRMRLVDGIDEQPISFVHVFAVAGADGQVVVDRGFATQDGVVVLPDLAAEGLTLSIFTHDRRWTGTASVAAGKETNLGILAMSHGVAVEGTVTDEKKRPLPGAHVGAFGQGWQQDTDAATLREFLFRRVHTDAEGRFRIEGFGRSRPGVLGRFAESVDLAVWAPDRAPAALRIDIQDTQPGETATGTIALEPGAFLSLDLQEERRLGATTPVRPIHGAVIDAEFARDGSDLMELWHWGMLGGPVASRDDWHRASVHLLFEARSEDGYMLGPLRPGPYDLFISHPKYVPFRQRLTVIKPGHLLIAHGVAKQFSGRTSHFRFEMKRSSGE